MKAKMAILFINAVAKDKFPDDWVAMSKHTVDWFLSIGNYVSTGSHKYVPEEKLNTDLGLPNGAGVFGYVKFEDGSYLLMTCHNGLAYWDGNKESKAEFLEKKGA